MTETSPNPQLVVVNEESLHQDFSLIANAFIYEQRGQSYCSTVKDIPSSQIDAIVNIVMRSKTRPIPDLSEYGITEETIAQNLDLMVREASAERFQSLADAPANLHNLFAYHNIAAHAIEKIATRTDRGNSTTTIRMIAAGLTDLVISSGHEYGLRLPWSVSMGERHWLCYAKQLPALLADLVSDESAAILRQQFSWHYNEKYAVSEAEVDDLSLFTHYGRSVRHHFDSERITQEVKALPGYDQACAVFDIATLTGVSIPNMLVRDGEYVLENQSYLRLKVLPPAIVDEIGWSCEGTWTGLLTKRKALEEAAQKTNWLTQWKMAGGKNLPLEARSIFAEILENGQESWFDDESLEAIWDKYELSTKPDFHFYLRNGNKCFFDVFVGFPFETSIVTTIENKQNQGVEIVFDKIAVTTPSFINHHVDSQFFIPQPAVRSRPYAVVANTGIVELINLPANKNAMRVVGHPLQDGETVDDVRREDPYTWDEVEELYNRNTSNTPHAVQSDQANFGLVGRDGLVIVSPQYEYIEKFSEGLAKIRTREGLYGFIDTTGNLVIEPQFERAHFFRQGLAVVQKEGKWGYIDTRGDTVIPFVYANAHPFYEGLAAVKSNNQYGYIDKTGAWIIAPRFTRARRFIDGRAQVQIDGRRGYIDHSGKIMGERLYKKLGLFWEGLAVFSEGAKCGYINANGETAIPADYLHATPFRDGTAMVRVMSTGDQITSSGGENIIGESQSPQERFINKRGEFVEPAKTLGGSRMELHANILRTRDKALKRFAKAQGDSTFNLVTVHASAGWFKEGLCPVEYQGKWGAINTNGTLVLPAKFDELGAREREWFSEGLIPACEGGKWGAIDITGTYIFRTDFEQIGLFYKGFAAVRQGTKYGFINTKGEVLVAPQFDTVSGFDKHGLAHIGLLRDTPAAPFPASFV